MQVSPLPGGGDLSLVAVLPAQPACCLGDESVKVSCPVSSWPSVHACSLLIQIYKIGQGYLIKDGKLIKNNASTDYDLSDKSINPLVSSGSCPLGSSVCFRPCLSHGALVCRGLADAWGWVCRVS